ncbi:hypothetical protein C3477_24950 [Mycobacterium kansasii]|uniref:hypothetical protein n=1 Tax=Mycobacterium kansasii TaxID=1768 RepID=UPI000CDD2533|nr:hypothetical protein [Mycobacterium kansasii]POX84837.1 hypothetical protein C3B43_22430 [Mycobacterium kansasii]POX97537.1 hypothetical protein C3477_24950 [Mycobacterium kansasii]POY15934.1 hypothetical protein C3476_23750 [Mycobacterium kansasii]
MAGNLPQDVGDSSGNRRPVAPSTQTYIAQSGSRLPVWPAIVFGTIAAFVAAAALIVALIPSTPVTPLAPVYTTAETAAAQRQLCSTYELVAQASRVDTAGSDKALARIATTNGALMLYMAAANPALDASHRDAARALATAEGTLTATGSYGVATDAEYQAVLDDAIAKDAAMKKVCGDR